MCGIWAIFGSEGDIAFQCNCVHKITHRGPDAFRIESINHFPNSCLAFHRLAIVDDLCGMQPMRTFQHPYIYLIYNGEIYNFKELQKTFGLKQDTACDGEIILHLYAKGGIEFAAKHLDGVFFFCLMDTKNRTVHLGRDTFGVRPGFRITTEEGFLAVCSEAKGLIGLSYDKAHVCDTSKLEHFPPGHVETYSFDNKGKAVMTKRTRYHKIGEQPAYTTFPITIVSSSDAAKSGGDRKGTKRPHSIENGIPETEEISGEKMALDVDEFQSRITPTITPQKDEHMKCPENINSSGDDIKQNIRSFLTMAVRKRLMADRRIGCLLSGGLDSSLVTALVVKLAKELGFDYKIQTFSIGMEGSTDLEAADKVAKYLDTEHHKIVFTPEEGIEAVENVIRHLESYDITTVRASVGMYLISKYIKEKTDTTVILSGEGADEVAQGYIYFHKAPTGEEASKESRRLCDDLYMYDVLRADRTTAAWGLEVRVPFLDHRFSHYYMSLPDQEKRPKNGIEKHLLRSAFSDQGLLPDEILWRPKEAFSDGVSSVKQSWYEVLQSHIDVQITDQELEDSSAIYTHNSPRSKEALYYRSIFEKFYPGMGKCIPYFWMPKWSQSTDPSARTLKHYKQ